MKKIVLRYDCVNKIKVEKSTLLRIVKTPEGKIEVDPSGKLNGHGVYLTPNKETLDKAIKTKALEKALETNIPEEVYLKIGRYVK
ncbi:MAG: YlxR family protein [Bacilli bacterium]|jgi:predicted RNA-binding protein YlxR (DUF448 family)|nr:YlxR family protein [Bacilli bacterium]